MALFSWSVARLGTAKMMIARGNRSLLRSSKHPSKGRTGGVSLLKISLLSHKGPKFPKMRQKMTHFWRIWPQGLAMDLLLGPLAAHLSNNFWLGMALIFFLKGTLLMISRKSQMSILPSKALSNLSSNKFSKRKELGKQKSIKMGLKSRKNLMKSSKPHYTE